jgi:1-acyl-sn-glycerol-3-phosphate acyltransferase
MKNLSAVEALTSINTQEMLEAIGLDHIRRGRALLEKICLPAAKRFAKQIVSYDEMVGILGLREASLWVLEKHIRRLEVAGGKNIPSEGPLLIVSNHPGLSDAMALFASLPRSDLRIVAAERAFLLALNHTSQRLIYLKPGEQNGSLRRISRHLRTGGAVLLFPGGKIEPDPAMMDGASESLQCWSKSIGLIVRLVKEIQVVPAIVSGVVCAAAQQHPFTRIRKEHKDRERFGAMLQTIIPAYKNVAVRVAFGSPLDRKDLLADEGDTESITEVVIQHTRRLLEMPPCDWQVIFET